MQLLKFLGSAAGFLIVVSVMISYYAPDSPPGRVVSDVWDGVGGAWDGIRGLGDSIGDALEGEPEFQTLDEEVDYLIESREDLIRVNQKKELSLAYGGHRCLMEAFEGRTEIQDVWQDFKATPAGSAWIVVRDDGYRREDIAEYVGEHGSAEVIAYRNQVEDIQERIIRACGG